MPLKTLILLLIFAVFSEVHRLDYFFAARVSKYWLAAVVRCFSFTIKQAKCICFKRSTTLICVQASPYPLNGFSKANREPPSRKVLLVPTSRGIMAKVVVLSVKEEMHQKGEEGGRPCLDLFPTWQQEERIRKRSRASAAAEHARQQFIRKRLSHLQHIKRCDAGIKKKKKKATFPCQVRAHYGANKQNFL